MTKTRVLLLLMLVVCVSVFRENISRIFTDLFGHTNRVIFVRNSGGKGYSALQPYSYVVVDPTPYAPWTRIDFDHAWLRPNALTNTALTYALDPRLASLILDEWEGEPSIDRLLASISPTDNFFYPGDSSVVHPYSLFAGNRGGATADSSNSFFLPANVPGGPLVNRRTSTDPAPANPVASVPEPSTAALFAAFGSILVCLGRLRPSHPAAQVE